MRLGIDVSTYLEEKAAGAKYFDGNIEINPLSDFRKNNVDIVRLRVWNDPYSKDGKPYLGGTNDLKNVIKLIEETRDYGYKYMIDFHYSDFWADPGKQTLPKAWANLSFDELLVKVYEFTRDSLIELRKIDTPIEYIQIGNEITNGMMWPYGELTPSKEPNGERENYENFIKLLNAGIKGAREVVPSAKIIIHLERSFDYKVYEEVFSKLEEAKVDYDLVGMSYYPYWHGTFDQLFFNINNLKIKFNHNTMITELGFGFTLEDYIFNNNGQNGLKISKDTLEAQLEYEISPSGQAAFVEDLLRRSKENDIEGVVYWEPLWIPGDTICWSSKEGQEYIHEEGKPTRNEWCNQCLFDYAGKKLPAFNKFKL